MLLGGEETRNEELQAACLLAVKFTLLPMPPGTHQTFSGALSRRCRQGPDVPP